MLQITCSQQLGKVGTLQIEKGMQHTQMFSVNINWLVTTFIALGVHHRRHINMKRTSGPGTVAEGRQINIVFVTKQS